jgi:1-deoxy-D-xylulose-5-phosphate reductoisomerase
MRKRVIVVGATGSIGRQTLDVLESRPELFEVSGLSAHRDATGLRAAGARFPGAALCLSGVAERPEGIALRGAPGLDELISGIGADIVVNGAAGAGGLGPSVSALKSGANLALANKESVVMAWPLLQASARASGSRILPVDSEHAALFQLRERIGADNIDELIITASGGAFRDLPISALDSVTPDAAATHPNWNMGRKITIDSATMANKGLEVIEASRLFDMPPDRVSVLVHPQSLVHAIVRARDGSLYAQLSEPDMRVPIQNALTWPDCLPCPFGRLGLAGRTLEFREPEAVRYPLLGLAYDALASGEGATIAYNASNEVAVAAFEAGRIAFTDIAPVVARTIESPWPSRVADLGSIFDIDGASRRSAEAAIREIEC